jgi:hypothetical protein
LSGESGDDGGAEGIGKSFVISSIQIFAIACLGGAIGAFALLGLRALLNRGVVAGLRVKGITRDQLQACEETVAAELFGRLNRWNDFLGGEIPCPPATDKEDGHLVCSLCGILHDAHAEGMNAARALAVKDGWFSIEGKQEDTLGIDACPECLPDLLRRTYDYMKTNPET